MSEQIVYERINKNHHEVLASNVRPRYTQEELLIVPSKQPKKSSWCCCWWRCFCSCAKYIFCGRHRRYTLFLFFLFGILSSSSFYHSSFPTYRHQFLHSSYQRIQQTFSFRKNKDIIKEQSLGLFHLKKNENDDSSSLTLNEWHKLQNKVHSLRQSSLFAWPQPMEFECPSIHFLKNDWVMCLPSSIGKKKQSCLIYSSGKIQHDTNFTLEEELYQLTTTHPYYNNQPCEIHVFDPDYDKKISHPKIQFHDWGWWNGEETEMAAKFQTIHESVTKLHHTHHIVNFLFLDCESCELDIYQDIVNDDTITFLQIVVHIHKTSDEILQNFFKTMRDHHYVIFYQNTINKSMEEEETIYGFLKLHPSFFY